MSLTLKLFSLVTRTLAKPIGNTIKQQAREHERFRKLCVGFAQRIHRIDMRMRLGLLQDPATIERQIKREAQEAEEKRLRSQHRPLPGTPTVRTEEEMQADTEARQREKRFIEGKVKNDEKRKEKRLIRPLSEAKAIDSGANFISEAFIFGVGLSLLLFENFRSRRKENNRRDMVKERLDKLEDDVERTQQEKELLEEELADLRSRVQALPFPMSSPRPPSKPKKPPTKPEPDESGKEEDSSNAQGSEDGSPILPRSREVSATAVTPKISPKQTVRLPGQPQKNMSTNNHENIQTLRDASRPI